MITTVYNLLKVKRQRSGTAIIHFKFHARQIKRERNTNIKGRYQYIARSMRTAKALSQLGHFHIPHQGSTYQQIGPFHGWHCPIQSESNQNPKCYDPFNTIVPYELHPRVQKQLAIKLGLTIAYIVLRNGISEELSHANMFPRACSYRSFTLTCYFESCVLKLMNWNFLQTRTSNMYSEKGTVLKHSSLL